MADTQDDILQRCRNFFERTVTSQQYRDWASQAVTAWSFYEGNQYTLEEIQQMEANCQPVIVTNLIAPKINNVSGQDIQTRTKIRYRPRTVTTNVAQMSEEAQKADALTDLATYVQERNESSFKMSETFKSGLVCGLGWIDLCAEPKYGIKINFVPHDQMVWDIADTTSNLTNQRFTARQHRMGLEEAKAKFPDKEEELEGLQSAEQTFVMYRQGMTPQYDNPIEQESEFMYYDTENGIITIVELQYKKLVEQYEVLTQDGRVIYTFEKSEAEKAAASKKDITIRMANKIFVAYFAAGILLDHFELEYQTGEFTYLPFVVYREKKNLIPFGVVRAAIDSQRSFNKGKSKWRWMMNARQIIMDSDAVDNIADLAANAARPNGIMQVKPGKKLELQTMTNEIQFHERALMRDERDIQAAMGIYDESLGAETNATSGIAIQKRQVGSVRNNAPAFDALRNFKKRVGEILLQLMQSYFTEETAFAVTKDDEIKVLRLNTPVVDNEGKVIKGKDGKPMYANDVSTGKYDVFVDEMPDVSTQMDIVQERVQNMLMNGVQPTPGLLELFGVPKSLKIYQELTSGQGPQVPQGPNSASPAQPQGAMPAMPAGPQAGTSPSPV